MLVVQTVEIPDVLQFIWQHIEVVESDVTFLAHPRYSDVVLSREILFFFCTVET